MKAILIARVSTCLHSRFAGATSGFAEESVVAQKSYDGQATEAGH